MRPLIITFLFIVTVKTSAQVNIICPKLTDSTLNYFYIGVDNPIEIAGIKDPGNYAVTISGGRATMTRASTGKYIVRASSETKNCQVQLIKNNKTVFKKDFIVSMIPDPAAGLAGYYDTAMSRNAILLNPFLTVFLPNCYIKNYMIKVTSFQVTLIENNDSLSSTIRGAALGGYELDLIKKAGPGSKLLFDEIRAVLLDGRTRKLVSFWITIE